MGYIQSGNMKTPNLDPPFKTPDDRGFYIWLAHGKVELKEPRVLST